MPIGLYLDVAVGVDSAGADAWRAPHSFPQDLSVGAPPDIFNPTGQNWGLATLHPQELIETDFAQFRQMLRSAMRYAGAIRIDHALGLYRLFLIPSGLSPAQGGYVKYPFEALLAVIAQESVEAECLVIGEDLGTIPEGVCETLNDWGIWSYRVALFERDATGRFRDAGAYPANAIVTFNTHDLPPFRGWLASHDLACDRVSSWTAPSPKTNANNPVRRCARRWHRMEFLRTDPTERDPLSRANSDEASGDFA